MPSIAMTSRYVRGHRAAAWHAPAGKNPRGGRRGLHGRRLRHRRAAGPVRRDLRRHAAVSQPWWRPVSGSSRERGRAPALARGRRVLGRQRQRRRPGPFVAAYEDIPIPRHTCSGTRTGQFTDALGPDSPLLARTTGCQWADFDRDGRPRLVADGDFPDDGRHRLFRNELPERRREFAPGEGPGSRGRARNGAEVRLFAEGGKLLGTRLVATGDGYGSQSDVPVHFGLRKSGDVSVEVTFLSRDGRRRQRLEGIDPREWAGRVLVVKAE